MGANRRPDTPGSETKDNLLLTAMAIDRIPAFLH